MHDETHREDFEQRFEAEYRQQVDFGTVLTSKSLCVKRECLLVAQRTPAWANEAERVTHP